MEQKEFSVRFLDKVYQAHYIKTPEWTAYALDKLMSKDILFGLDTETCAKKGCEHYPDPGLSPILGEIRLLQIFDGSDSYLFDWRYLSPELFRLFLESKRFIAHNAIFDLAFLKAKDIHNINIGCTFIASKLIMHEKYPTDIGLSASLSGIVQMIFKEDVLKVLQDSEWGAEDLTFEQIEYAALDPICVLKVADKISPTLVKKNLTKVYSLYKDAQHPLADMQINGLNFDIDLHKALIEKWRGLLLESRSTALKETGLKEITPMKLSAWLAANLPQELINVWPKTPGGALSTDKNAFKEFAHIKVLTPLLEFSKYETLLSTFGQKLGKFVNPLTKRIHPKYNIAGARTGRLSSNNPNLQNQPSDRTEADFRKIYIARPGHVMMAADFNQIEVRVAAEVSQDKAMLAVYRNGQDIYKVTAQKVLGKTEITPLERQQMKAVVLGRLFGLGAGKFGNYAKVNYGLDVTEDEAYEFIQGFKDTFPEFTAWQYEQSSRCEKSLKAQTIFGKVSALTPTNYYGTGLNVPVQGSASEINLCSLNRVFKRKRKEFLLLMTTHDEIVGEVPSAYAEECSSLLNDCMVKGYLDVFPQGVTNGLVKIKIGNNLAECK